jgi:hypothetical protein
MSNVPNTALPVSLTQNLTSSFRVTWIEMENGQAVNNLSAYYDKKSTPVQKAYKNPAFLNSGQARNIRILCELEVRVAFFKKRN